MTATPDPTQTLKSLAEDFADQLTARVQRIIADSPPFEAVVRPPGRSGQGRVLVTPLASSDPVTQRDIPLKVSGQHRLSLMVRFECCWDTGQSFLAIDESLVHVFSEESTDPLFRVEYVRDATSAPAAHIQVHAHRDEIVYLMGAGERGKAGARSKRDRMARLSEFHLPTGGPRFRLCLEDVLGSKLEAGRARGAC